MAGNYLSYRHSALNTESTKFFTYIIIVFCIIFTVLGAMMFAMGLYMLLEPDFKRWIQDLGMEFYWTGVYILLAAGIIVMLQSFFGICGAYQKKKTFLIVYMIGLALCFILEITGAAYLLNNGVTGSQSEVWLDAKFMTLISEYNYVESSKRTMSIVQEWVGCCGSNGVADYMNWNKVIPSTCFDPVTGNAWYREGFGYMGCTRGFALYLEGMTGWICGIALTLAFFQIFVFLAAMILACIKHDFKHKSVTNLDRR